MNRAAAARPSGGDAEPEPWERAAFEAAVHSDPIELAGAKRALKASLHDSVLINTPFALNAPTLCF